MGQKIKPSFKSEFDRVNEGWHLFRIVEPKIDTIAKENRKEKDGVTNDRNFVVRSVVEGGDEDGIEIQEFFANYSKKEFGLSRLAGLMIKTESIPPTDEIDVDTMRTEKFETKFKMSLPKRLFGGRVKHSEGQKKEGSRVKHSEGQTEGQKKEGSEEHNIFANIIEYATVKEYNEIIAKQGEKGKSKGSDKGIVEKSMETVQKTASEGKEAKDPWA